MSLINREDLIAEYDRVYIAPGIARKLIVDAPEVKPEPKWIPVSERLPEDSSSVLITHRGGVSYGWYNGRYFERGANTNHRKLQTVVAWMPLPEPYREEGEN